MSDDIQVTLTITVTPEQASYILALVSLWSSDQIELNTSLRSLPPLIRDIALEIDAQSDFKSFEIIDWLAWTKRDIDTINAVLSHEKLKTIPTE